MKLLEGYSSSRRNISANAYDFNLALNKLSDSLNKNGFSNLRIRRLDNPSILSLEYRVDPIKGTLKHLITIGIDPVQRTTACPVCKEVSHWSLAKYIRLLAPSKFVIAPCSDECLTAYKMINHELIKDIVDVRSQLEAHYQEQLLENALGKVQNLSKVPQ